MIRKFLFLLFCSVGALAQENTSVIDLLNSSSNDIVVAQKGTANASAVSGKASEFNFVNSVQDGFENQLDLFFINNSDNNNFTFSQSGTRNNLYALAFEGADFSRFKGVQKGNNNFGIQIISFSDFAKILSVQRGRANGLPH